ncbi:hypothetical protein BX661DRAFT_187458 [Kickxella alabastrina]|uniref:uncharacterized protein n=1 Tax=Kickxella alabastrina TaxID=61397 RepID=UPI00221F790D|nr:uncharacterized protein BX661DRAFT_189729 [Kickxella alabastrina]XP_051389395.1 uncharacterized protein BX661DRAFT_187458 [Kickxella alabastrina]KAI7819862.1 hypothetical protein BX661DRAFT_189729 [Kickxella alabastrina]KAI7822476.1 hypothetical protein BX661DRAFT_187458 [Kickxella alabastrina]
MPYSIGADKIKRLSSHLCVSLCQSCSTCLEVYNVSATPFEMAHNYAGGNFNAK